MVCYTQDLILLTLPTDIHLSRLIAVFTNSFYSFYWDVTKDWDLSLLSLTSAGRTGPRDPATRQPLQPYGLRRSRYFHSPSLYYTVISVDLILRCTWSFKLSPHLHHLNDMEGGIFVLELAEVFRRWVWIFLRVETEWVRREDGGKVQEDVLLGEYGVGKYDDD